MVADPGGKQRLLVHVEFPGLVDELSELISRRGLRWGRVDEDDDEQAEPEAAAPVANYVPYVISGNLVFVSGQIPVAGGEMQLPGCVGEDLSAEQGQQAARLCALGLLAQLREAAGGFSEALQRQLFNQCHAVTEIVFKYG